MKSEKSGSALIIVLAVTVVLAFLVADFAAHLKSELKAGGSAYEESLNTELARSAWALAQLEVERSGASLYANGYGDAYFVSGSEDYETQIEELQLLREGLAWGRGKLAYRLVYTPYELDVNQLDQSQWHRLFEIACDLDEGDERSALVDCVIDWTDSDTLARASGMEEEDYQELDPPRHVKNGPFEMTEELLRVYGITEALFYGYENPLREEDGMLWGGGLQRYLIGDNSPAGRASAQYVLKGTYPTDDDVDEEEELEYKTVQTLPEKLYLVATGFQDSESEDTDWEGDELELREPTPSSRRMILVELTQGQQKNEGYSLSSWTENLSGEYFDAILARGIPLDESEIFN